MQNRITAFSLKEMTTIALFAALIAVTAPISIPLSGSVPISLATLSVMLTGVLIGPYKGTLAVLIYLILGALGVPVFAGYSSGLANLFGMTGGYLFGYLPYAYLCGVFADMITSEMSLRQQAFRLFAGMVAGTIVCYALGTVWFCLFTRTTFAYALSVCVLPFLAGDTIKMILVFLITQRLRPFLQKRNIS